MAAPLAVTTPGLESFLKYLKSHSVEASIERLIALLKRRQIKKSRSCAVATAHLLHRVVAKTKWTDVETLIERIHNVGQRLCTAQPREMAVGNIVRRVLHLIRSEAEDTRDIGRSGSSEADSDPDNSQENKEPAPAARPGISSSISTFSPLRHGAVQPADLTTADPDAEASAASSVLKSILKKNAQRPPMLSSHTSYAATNAAPMVTSMFNLLSRPETPSPTSTPPGARSPSLRGHRDLKPDIIEGIGEIIDELDQVDSQIAAYAPEHIHANEIILTYGASQTVQRFLLAAAKKCQFTVIHAEGYPNDHEAAYGLITGTSNRTGDDEEEEHSSGIFNKTLTAAGVNVILIPDSATYALMSRVNKVILGTNAVLANGGLVAAAGSRVIAKAAKEHKTPVVVVSGVYKLSPVYPFDFEALVEHGDAGKVAPFGDGEFVDGVKVLNPLYDYVPAELVDLYITNVGGHAPSYLYKIVDDHYRMEDNAL